MGGLPWAVKHGPDSGVIEFIIISAGSTLRSTRSSGASGPETLQATTRAPGAHRSGHAGWGVAAVCTIVGARRPSCQERAVLRRGRPPTRGGDECWAVHRTRRLQVTRLGGALSCAEVTRRDPDMSSTAYEYAPSANCSVDRRSASSRRAFGGGGASTDVSRGGGRRVRGCAQPGVLCALWRAACARTHAYARGRVRVCVCVCTWVPRCLQALGWIALALWVYDVRVRGRARCVFALSCWGRGRMQDAVSSCVPGRLARYAVRDARALLFLKKRRLLCQSACVGRTRP